MRVACDGEGGGGGGGGVCFTRLQIPPPHYCSLHLKLFNFSSLLFAVTSPFLQPLKLAVFGVSNFPKNITTHNYKKCNEIEKRFAIVKITRMETSTRSKRPNKKQPYLKWMKNWSNFPVGNTIIYT